MTKTHGKWAHHAELQHAKAEAQQEFQVRHGKHTLDQNAVHVSNKERQNGMKDHKMGNSNVNQHMDTSPKKAKTGSRSKNQKKKSPQQHPEQQQEVLAAELEQMGYGSFNP